MMNSDVADDVAESPSLFITVSVQPGPGAMPGRHPVVKRGAGMQLSAWLVLLQFQKRFPWPFLLCKPSTASNFVLTCLYEFGSFNRIHVLSNVLSSVAFSFRRGAGDVLFFLTYT
jgi:hypothetical protein